MFLSAPQQRRQGSTAFTRLDLLTLVMMVGLLLMLMLPGRAATSNRSKRSACVNNLGRFAQTTQIYANENFDQLPIITTGTWAWDVPIGVTDALLRAGLKTNQFYCPGTTPRFTPELNYFNPAPHSLWNFAAPAGGFRIIGYVTAYSGPANNYSQFSVALTNQNFTMNPERPRLTATTFQTMIPAPRERVLLADATISENQGGTALNPGTAGSFTTIVGGFSAYGVLIPHTSPHLRSLLPAGGNLAFKDGHVDWRPFSAMSQRAVGGIRGFWW